jgi:membrane protein implicated in regulation of membrane protease activity
VDLIVVWLVCGLALVVAEVVTGTFYLLVLGIAAFAGAAIAWAGGPFWAQAIVAGAGAVAGCVAVHHHRRGRPTVRMRGVDVGQPATFESWIDKSARHARVRYRDASWEALVAGDAAGDAGEVLYVSDVDGNTLKVSKSRPA